MSDDALIEAMADEIAWAIGEPLHSRSPGIVLAAIRALAAIRKTHAVVGTKPVLWRVKDYGDDWVLCRTEQGALGLAKAMGEAFVQPLYPMLAAAEETNND